MEPLTLYRGIAVPSEAAETVMHAIRTNGLSGNEGDWKFQVPRVAEVRNQLEALFTKPDLNRDDLFAATAFPGICAGGTENGAAYYATIHNFLAEKNDYPVIIEFSASLDQVYVDSRDFLCTAFQLWDRHSPTHQDWQSRILQEIFGSAIGRYFTAACQSSDQSYRIAMCNLAAFDSDVVEGHYRNKKIIAGRYRTRFSSAFFVQALIEAERISQIYSPTGYCPQEAYISVSEFQHGGAP